MNGTVDYSRLINVLNLAKKALEFYSNNENYKIINLEPVSYIEIDHGHQARYAMQTIELLLEPEYDIKRIEEYNKTLMMNQQMEIEESIKNMNFQMIEYRQKYNELLESGMFFEILPELSGNWEIDKTEFITKLLTDNK